MATSLKQLTDGLPSLGSYAGVLEEIDRLLQDPNTTVTDLGDCIEKDPDLTSRLLRLANSTFYRFSRRLETVAESVSVIGIQQVQDLVLASCVIEAFEGIPRHQVDMESFWRHSLGCGICARALANERQLLGAERLFICGLLHDLGRLVLLSQAPHTAADILNLYHKNRMLLREAEREVLGFDHAQVGEEVLRLWQFPPSVISAVAFHHQPMAAGVFQLESSAVHLADHLVHAMELGSSGERFVPPLSLRAWERIGLSPELIESIMNTVDDQIEAVEASLLRSHAGS
jgi:HD-like signal output (HDOD) protein